MVSNSSIPSRLIGGKPITLHISKKKIVMISIIQPYRMWGTLVKWWGASQVGSGITVEAKLAHCLSGGFLAFFKESYLIIIIFDQVALSPLQPFDSVPSIILCTISTISTSKESYTLLNDSRIQYTPLTCPHVTHFLQKTRSAEHSHHSKAIQLHSNTTKKLSYVAHIDLHGLHEYLWHILLILCTPTLTFRQSTISILPLPFTKSAPNIDIVTAITSTNFPVKTTITTAIPTAARTSTAVWARSQPRQEQGLLCGSGGGEESTGGLSHEGYGRGGVVTSYSMVRSRSSSHEPVSSSRRTLPDVSSFTLMDEHNLDTLIDRTWRAE